MSNPFGDDENDGGDQNFPVKIDLGHKPEVAVPGGSPQKDEPFYPTLYISDVKGLEALPKSGQALIDYELSSVTHRKDKTGATSSAELKVTCIHLPPGGGASEPDEDLETGMKKTAKKLGAPTGDEGPEPENEDEEEGDGEEKE